MRDKYSFLWVLEVHKWNLHVRYKTVKHMDDSWPLFMHKNMHICMYAKTVLIPTLIDRVKTQTHKYVMQHVHICLLNSRSLHKVTRDHVIILQKFNYISLSLYPSVSFGCHRLIPWNLIIWASFMTCHDTEYTRWHNYVTSLHTRY